VSEHSTLGKRWLGVELRHLLALQAIAEEGSFGRAAGRLGYTQSAISQQLAALERIVGQRLVERTPGQPASLTAAGRLLVQHTVAIGRQLSAARADIDALAQGASGALRVGTFQSAGAKIVPEILRRFLDGKPGVEIDLAHSVTDADLALQVEAGELDLAFAVLPVPDGPLQVLELLEDQYLLVVQRGLDLPPLERSDGETPMRLPVVCFRNCRTTERVLAHLRLRGIEPHVVLRSDQNETLQRAAAAGLGVALMPWLSIDDADPEIECVDLGRGAPYRTIVLIWHRDRRLGSVAVRFRELALEVSTGLAVTERKAIQA
jgi:DNA-binding transcriptional LysR family regulator